MIENNDISERRSRLSSAKRALLESRLKGSTKKAAKFFAIEKRPDQNTYPLSFAQERFWFLDQLEPGNPVYNRPMGLRLKGALNVSKLRQAINEILRRHEVLRANFSVINSRPTQSIAPDQTLSLDVVDLSTVDQADREEESKRLSVEEVHKPFDLAKDPLLRAKLFRMGIQDYILLLVMHHIACDGWSARLFIRELAVLYDAFSAGKSSPLPEPFIQYADYAYWQRQRLQGEAFDRLVTYWRKRLADSPPVLNLPTDRPRQGTRSYRGAQKSVMISSSLLKLLKTLSRDAGVTLFMTLLAAFKVLLYRYTGQTDIVVGSPIAGRSRFETESLIGFFVNTLILRTDLSGNPSFRRLLCRIRELALEDYEHGDLPFEKLVQVMQPQRDVSRSPLFQVLFNLENVPDENVSTPQLTIREFEFDSGTATFDLNFEMVENKEGLCCSVNYLTDFFDSDTIKRLIGHFRTLLENIVANPDHPISQIPLLSVSEQNQLLVDWNNSATVYPQKRCIHHLFELQVEQTPDAIALVYEDRQLTYRQLNCRANQVAHTLKSLGVGPEVLVGICVERSLEMVIGLLGILKAGGAYVPLDPAYPKKRLTLMLEETGLRVMVTQNRLLKGLPGTETHVVCLDADWEAISNESKDNPISETVAENLAYVMYTSGSTGRPKGVCVNHRGVVRLVKDTNYIRLSAEDVFLQFSPVSFDASTFEIWASLLNGGRLVIFPAYMPSLEELGHAIENYKITTLWLTAGLFHLMVEDQIDKLHNVRQLLAGGDVLSVAHVKKACRQLNNCQLINGYGPTENTTFTCCYPISDLKRIAHTVPLGRPIANTRVYILDAHLQPVPEGVPGELYISGDGLARGYLNRPELTAEKFIPNPFCDIAGDRLYQTGDLARYLPNGCIEFLGRHDHQVKIRGYRIELTEIEAALANHPSVRDAVVLAVEDKLSDKLLLAYVVADSAGFNRSSELRSFLQDRLPDYMVPRVYLYLDSLPLTPNGKVDRRALPRHDAVRPELENGVVAPKTSMEKRITEIWVQLLGVPKIGIHDNFFELGGHSLLATKLISQIRDTFKARLSVHDIFETPTVAELAEVVETACQEVQETATPSLRALKQDKNLPLSFAQQRLWFLDQLEQNSSLYNIPWATRLRGPLNIDALQRGLNTIVNRHAALRTTFAADDGIPKQVIAEKRLIDLAMDDLSGIMAVDRESEAKRRCIQAARLSFDLSSDLMLRARLYRLDKQDHVLLLVVHHIAFDGWSLGVLFRELSVLYEAFAIGNPLRLPDLAMQYKDFAIWQRQWLQGEVLQRQLAYWKQQLVKAAPALELPVDQPRSAIQDLKGSRQSTRLSKSLTQALKKLCNQEQATLYMALLAAFKVLLHRYTAQDDIIVGSPIAGRHHPNIEGLIGFFVNTLVMRTDMSGNPSFRELLSRVRKVALGAYAHQDIPFEKLVEELQPARDLHRNPLFQVFFNLVQDETFNLELRGLKTKPFHFAIPDSNFDLTLQVNEFKTHIQLELIYKAGLFGEDRMIEMLNQYRNLLSQIVENPDQRIAFYSLVSEESRHLLPDPRTDLAEPHQETVMNMFACWATHTPQKEAVSKGEQTWTYAQLAECSHTLARQLLKRGVEKSDVIAICGLPSFGLIASMMGVLLCGGVMLPVDPNLPDRRKQQMLREGSAKSLIYVGARQPEDDWFDKCLDLDVLCVDADAARAIFDDRRPDLPAVRLPEVIPEDPAYIFFTSGSTGMPKGVLGCHKGLSHFLRWQGETFNIEPADRVALVTSLSFDAVLRDIFLPLTHGAALCLPKKEERLAPRDIFGWLARKKVSILHVVPTRAQSWLDDVPKNISLASLRQVFFAGEPLTDTFVNRWRSCFPSTEIINLYGPTETTMTKCFYRVPSEMLSGIQPLGRPMPQSQALVMAENNRLCGIGERGEIAIRTPFRTLGYINESERTRRQFVKNPYRDDDRDMLYYTGDLGRYRSDGMLEILGRIDDQIKIRGVRVEPNEVAAVLSRHPDLKTAVVLSQKDEQGHTFMVAYVVTAEPDRFTSSELMSYLSHRLPTAMIPTRFIFLDALPVTPQGKVDRKALPAASPIVAERKDAFVGACSPLEEALLVIWRDVLGIEQIDIHSNFFELGGHSLIATRVISQIRDTFQTELPLRSIFEAPTVAELANKIIQHRMAQEQHGRIDLLLAEIEQL